MRRSWTTSPALRLPPPPPWFSPRAGEKVSCNKAGAEAVGKEIARLAKEKSIEKVVFDRNGYLYHGKIKAVADGAREGGLEF